MNEYVFDKTFASARGNAVGVDTKAGYGYWERRDGSEGGGLWFDRTPEGWLELGDYDGAGELPQAVVDALRANGFIVGAEFDC